MIGPTLVLVLTTVVLVIGGLAYVLLVWQPPHARETRLFLESRDADGMLQLAPTLRVASPEWMRLNLRDGRVVLACALGEHGESYEVGVVPLDRDPSAGSDPDELRYRLHREPREGGLGEGVAISDAAGARIGSLAASETRRLGLPVAWEGHVADRRYRLEGRAVHGGDEVLARLFPNPVPRLTPVQWTHEADDALRVETALLVLVLRWNEILARRMALRRDD